MPFTCDGCSTEYPKKQQADACIKVCQSPAFAQIRAMNHMTLGNQASMVRNEAIIGRTTLKSVSAKDLAFQHYVQLYGLANLLDEGTTSKTEFLDAVKKLFDDFLVHF